MGFSSVTTNLLFYKMLFEVIAWERNDRFDISHKLLVAYNIVYIYIHIVRSMIQQSYSIQKGKFLTVGAK